MGVSSWVLELRLHSLHGKTVEARKEKSLGLGELSSGVSKTHSLSSWGTPEVFVPCLSQSSVESH